MSPGPLRRATSRLRRLLTWRPPAVGTTAPRLSLTADDGTWIRIEDFVDQVNVLVVFVRDVDAPDSTALLTGLRPHAARLEALSTLTFGVATDRPGALRAARAAADLPFPLLYDPFAVEGRGWLASGRLLPRLRDRAVLVDKAGTIRHIWEGSPAPEAVLEAIAALAAPPAAAAPTAGVIRVEPAAAAQMLADEPQKWLLLDVRTRSEYEADHAPMAVHIPVDELPARVAELGRSDRVLCVCQAGGRSKVAAEFLASIGGKEIHDVAGGMSAWVGPRVTGGKAQ